MGEEKRARTFRAEKDVNDRLEAKRKEMIRIGRLTNPYYDISMNDVINIVLNDFFNSKNSLKG